MSTQMTTVTQLAPAPQRVSLLAAMASRYNMEPKAFADTLKATVMPSSTTNEQLAAFLLVAHEFDLNPITKEIYAFPARGGGITPVVGIDGWINLAQRRPEFDGMDFEYQDTPDGKPISCTCRLYRKDRSRPIVVTEYMSECHRNTDPWRSHPRRMLRHKTTVQAIRYAFGFSGIKDEDDAEVIRGAVRPAQTIDLNTQIAAQISHQPAVPAEDFTLAPQSEADLECQRIRDGMRAAADPAELQEWVEAAHEADISNEQRAELIAIATELAQ